MTSQHQQWRARLQCHDNTENGRQYGRLWLRGTQYPVHVVSFHVIVSSHINAHPGFTPLGPRHCLKRSSSHSSCFTLISLGNHLSKRFTCSRSRFPADEPLSAGTEGRVQAERRTRTLVRLEHTRRPAERAEAPVRLLHQHDALSTEDVATA